MLICDIFDVRASVIDGENPTIEYLFYTDLPAGTRVILSCQRTYHDMASELSLWTGHSETMDVMPAVHGSYNGGRGRINVVESDKRGLALFQQINRSNGPGIKSKVSDELTLVFTVGARQRIRDFGKNNNELSGQMVNTAGGIHVVEVQQSIHIPMRDDIQP
jgi:hypothetical protein